MNSLVRRRSLSKRAGPTSLSKVANSTSVTLQASPPTPGNKHDQKTLAESHKLSADFSSSNKSRVTMKFAPFLALCSLASMLAVSLPAEEPAVASATETLAHAPAGSRIDIASGPDWRQLVQEDFAHVNSWDDTWSFTGSTIACTGKPVSVIRSKEQFTNFELVCEWRHLKKAGNSGIFLWTIPASLEKLAA